MKIKEGFLLRTLTGIHVVVPVGPASTALNGIIKLNNSGAFLWNLLINETTQEQLVQDLQEEYGIPAEQAERDVDVFLKTLRKIGRLAE